MSDVLKPSRIRPPPEISDLSPPLSPKSDKSLLTEKIDKAYVPADIDIPDNYVQYTLKNTKARPPVTWSNFLTELDYVNVAVLTITPGIAIWGLVSGVPLRWQTALFAVFYYYVTGLGITAGALYVYYYCRGITITKTVFFRVSPPLGTSLLQCFQATGIFPRYGWIWSCRGLYQMVVPWPSLTPPLHRHPARPVQRAQWLLVVSHRLDAD